MLEWPWNLLRITLQTSSLAGNQLERTSPPTQRISWAIDWDWQSQSLAQGTGF
jgi:hypothetical protein